MNTSKGSQLVTDFAKALNTLEGISITSTSISRNVFEYKGTASCLLYVKGRAEQPYRWGVTANVIDRLKVQPRPWYVILLFECREKGYMLSSRDAEHYIQNVWPLGRDGDYKPATGSYLSRNTALHSIKEFIEKIEKA
jgi:hypothetical protein